MSDKPAAPTRAKAESMAIRVSLVEDNPRIRRVFADWLSHAAGLQLVSQFPEAETALKALPQERPDVALVDINLPGRSGIECVRQLKPQLPAAQFVMLTVYEDTDRIFEALSAGASGYLLKQTRRADLLAALQQVHQDGALMSGWVARKVTQYFQQPSPPASSVTSLSDRERKVLELLSHGYLYKEIAETLGVSYDTVKTYGRQIYEKLHAHSRAQAVAMLGPQRLETSAAGMNPS
jgi:DNA-binding NarL/FixJ family response regulator